MKRLIIIVAAASVFASCAVTKTHSARTADVQCEITQMPTVVELTVAEKRETSDVFEWVNKLFSFKRRVGVKEKTQEAVAQILERANADVLIEPKVSIDRKIKPFSVEHTLSVSGYPAKYSSFRTATIEDIETVNALRKPAVYRTIRLADYMRPQIASLPRKTRNTIAIADAATKKPHWVRKNGYMGMFDAGLILGCENGSDDGLHISTTHGALIAHRVFLGLGLGYQYIPEFSIHEKRWDYYYEEAHMLNGFFNLRVYALNRRVSPFIDGRIGFSYSSAPFSDKDWNGYDVRYETGLYWDAGLGLSVGRFNISCVYAQYAAGYSNNDGFKIKLGVTF